MDFLAGSIAYTMEEEQSVLDSVFEDENFEDVEMVDVEEGELFELDPKVESGENNSDAGAKVVSGENISGADVKVLNAERATANPGQRKNKKKKKNKTKRGNSGPNITDMSRFVPDVCRHLRERKSYLVWAAVGCLGASALSDLVKEVDAIQACGGQKTTDGRRCRTGGGILWNLLKVRDPKAYKEIMKKGKEFEKQFKPHNISNGPVQNSDSSPQKTAGMLKDQAGCSAPGGSQEDSRVQNHLQPSNCEVKRQVSVHDRVRIPVAYDDLLGDE